MADILFTLPFSSNNRSHQLGLYLISPGWAEVDRLKRSLISLIDAGAPAIQLREPELGDRVSIDLLLTIKDHINSTGSSCVLVFNGQIKILEQYHRNYTKSYGLTHLHLKDTNISAKSVAEHFGPEIMLGRSCHFTSVDQLSERDQIDQPYLSYRSLSPIFQTISKDSKQLLGINALKSFKLISRLPVFALGGITPETVPSLKSDANQKDLDWITDGIALSGYIFNSSDPTKNLKLILDACNLS